MYSVVESIVFMDSDYTNSCLEGEEQRLQGVNGYSKEIVLYEIFGLLHFTDI